MESTKFDRSRRSDRVTGLLRTLLDDISGLTERTVLTIRRDVESYSDLPFDVHVHDNVVNLTNLLEGLIGLSAPSGASIEHAHFMGRQRALANLGLATATAGYHVAYGAVWQELLDLAEQTEDPQVTQELTAYVSPLWHWFQEMSGAFTASYVHTRNSMQATRSDRRAVVHEALRSGLGAEHRSRESVESLGFEPDGDFTVFFGGSIDPGATVELVAALEAVEGHVELLAASPETVVLAQGAEPTAIAAVMVEAGGVAGVGIGRVKLGLIEAAQGYGEARDAQGCTGESRPVAAFEQVWPLTIALDRSDLLVDMLGERLAVVQRNPHLVETVEAFAASRYSLTRTARAVHLHANTTKYRLVRWQELTGWDVFTVEGLLRSVLCVELTRVRAGTHDVDEAVR